MLWLRWALFGGNILLGSRFYGRGNVGKLVNSFNVLHTLILINLIALESRSGPRAYFAAICLITESLSATDTGIR